MVAPRRTPSQRRGEQRVEDLLNAAAEVIAESGYEAATMSAIAERAKASIGSLYQFFPNKNSVAHALTLRYCRQLLDRLTPLVQEAPDLGIESLSDRLVDIAITFMESHAGFIALFDAPINRRSDRAIRDDYRKCVADILMAHSPNLARENALLVAAISLEVLCSSCETYIDSTANERALFVNEVKTLLRLYLANRVRQTHRTQRSRNI